MTGAYYRTSGRASNTRAFIGSIRTPSMTNQIDFFDMASAGDASDFGDLSVSRSYVGSLSNNVRGLFGGGYDPSATNVIDYITIATTGNATDYGDLSAARYAPSGVSGSHGGIGEEKFVQPPSVN